ncbi:MAG: TraM recognition domain-containing protein, partial [Neomegalonema sp.]|nr:TraM recognition domain-containing protein [Neomegalonema sp.]
NELLKHALWACGKLLQGEDETGEKIFATMPLEESPWVERHDPQDVANYIVYYRGLASGVADLLLTQESRTADSFITGAQQALARFNISTRAHRKTKGATFRFAEQKEGDEPTTVFIVADASRIDAQKPVLGLLQWCMFQELKRHPNKERPVYLLADEATNFKIAELGSLLTWGRGYGLRLHLIIQSLSAFKKTYGEEVLNVLLSETEIKQFLPGQREPETLALIEKMLGQQSLVAQNRHGNSGKALFGAEGFDFREEGKPLLTADEIRRMNHGVLLLRRNKPIKIELPPIAAIEPFKHQIDINPFHGKPFLKKTVLRLKRRRPKHLNSGRRT